MQTGQYVLEVAKVEAVAIHLRIVGEADDSVFDPTVYVPSWTD